MKTYPFCKKITSLKTNIKQGLNGNRTISKNLKINLNLQKTTHNQMIRDIRKLKLAYYKSPNSRENKIEDSH